MKNKTVLITGSTDGIGRQAALDLARLGARLLIHGRREAQAESVLREIQEINPNAEHKMLVADLSSMRQTRVLAETINREIPKLDVLVNNAGVFMNDMQVTEDRFEMTFAVNYLSHFLLTHGCLDLLMKSAPSRILNLSSIAHQGIRMDFENLNSEAYFGSFEAYSLSKLASILFANELAERLQGTGVTANSLHPGVVSTKLLWTGFQMRGIGLREGAASTVYLASSPKIEKMTGKYFVGNTPEAPSPDAQDAAAAKRLWLITEEMLADFM